MKIDKVRAHREELKRLILLKRPCSVYQQKVEK
jgi:hypothetical protein